MGASKNSRKKKVGGKGQENGNGLPPAAKTEKAPTPAKPRSSPSASPSPSPSPPPTSVPAASSRSIVSVVGRLLAWYTLFTILFRCPEIPTSSSPTICHGYTQAHELLAPHLQPYYDTYASPYVEKVKPFITHANQIYIYPAVAVASANYEKYAQPTVAKARAITEKEYHDRLAPHVVKASKQFNILYDQHVAPHSEKLAGLVNAAVESPYWHQTKEHAEAVYQDVIIPTYKNLSPHVYKGLEEARHVYLVVLGPHIKQGAKVGGEWLEKNVWTGASGIWREYVEVQLERIRERLTTGNPSTEGYSHSSVSQSEDSSEASSAAESTPTEESAERKAAREVARKQIEADLASYTVKFEKHANEAIESLHAHVDELSLAAKNAKAPEIAKSIAELDQLVDRETNALRAVIRDLAKNNQPAATEEETLKNTLAAFDKLFTATRNSGALVKEMVQKLRWESQRFLAGVYDEVAAAADTRIEQVDALIESGISELGMKWAWDVDGVTYKDWARYHDLRKEFSGIRAKVVKAAEKNANLMGVTAWAEGEEWESGVVKRATAAAAELARLKRVGKKKIELADDSDDFSDRYISGEEIKKIKTTEVDANAEKVDISPQDPEDAVVKIQVGVAEAAIATEQREEYEEPTLAEKIKESVRDAVEEAKIVVEEVSEAYHNHGKHDEKVEKEDVIPPSEQAMIGIENVGNQIAEELQLAGAQLEDAIAQAGKIVAAEFESASKVVEDGYVAASKVAVNTFTPPPGLEDIVTATNKQIQALVDAAMEKIYGREKTNMEKAQDAFDNAVHGVADLAEQAKERVSIAIYGTKESNFEKATRVIGENVEKATEVVGEQLEAMKAKIEEAVYGKKEADEAELAYYSSLVASVNAKLQGVVAEARTKLSEAYEERKKAAKEFIGTEPVKVATEKVKEMYRDVKDEL